MEQSLEEIKIKQKKGITLKEKKELELFELAKH